MFKNQNPEVYDIDNLIKDDSTEETENTEETPPTTSVPSTNTSTPFGNVLPVKEDENPMDISVERTQLADKMFPPTQMEKAEPTNSSTGATVIVDEMEGFFSPTIINVEDLSDSQKEGYKNRIKEYYSSLANSLGRNPTFKELVEDMMMHASSEIVENNYNAIVLGWELNDFAKTDFNKIYDELFGSRKSKALEFFNYAESNSKTEKEQIKEQEVLIEKFEESQAPVTAIEETEEGKKVYISMSEFQTAESDLKFAHLSERYDETIEEEDDVVTVTRETNSEDLNQGQFVDSRELMNPNLYSAGTELDVVVPEDIDNIMVAVWDGITKKPIRFKDWAVGKDKNSDEYIGKIPMIIKNAEGKGVAFVHDIAWYNEINVAFGENPAKQAALIKESKEKLLNFRRAILANNNQGKITITQKKPGTKIMIPANKPTITINQANPEARLGYVIDTGNIVTSDGIIDFEDLINAKDLEIGHKYDVRQAGIVNGKKTYFASKVLYGNIDEDAKMSIIQAIRVYMSQFDTNEDFSSKAEVESIKKEVFNSTKLDLTDQQDLETYLNLFIQTFSGKAKSNKEISENVNSNPKIEMGTPYIAISQGRLVFGIKGVKLSKDDSNGNTLYMHPLNFKKDGKLFANLTTSALQRIFKSDFLGSFKQNMSNKHIESNTPVHIIGSTKAPDNYDNYLKDRYKTNIKSIRLPDGSYATFTQPVIQFTYQNQEPVQNTEKNKAQELVQQVAEEVTGTPIDENIGTKESIANNISQFESLGLSKEALEILKNIGGLNQGLASPNYEKLTDEMVQSMKVKLTKIEDLNTIDRQTVVQFIANQIMDEINPGKKNSLSKKDLIAKINKSFDELVKPKAVFIDAQISGLQTMFDSGKYPELSTVIEEMGQIRKNAEVLKNNWNFLINEAFEDYISKFTGITSTMSKDQKTIDVEIKDEKEAQDLVEKEEDQQEFGLEDNNQRDKDHSKESLEDNGKSSVSYILKRFLAKIPEYNKNGEVVKGFMGLTVYPGFDHYYNILGNMMSVPSKVESSIEDILIRLEQHVESKPWVKDFIERFKESDEQLKNSFLYDMSRENISMKYMRMSFNEKTGEYQLKVYDTNSNEILRVLQTQWKENFKQSPLLKGGTIVDDTVASKLLLEFNSWEKTGLPTLEVAQAWLKNFGIELSNESVRDLMNNGYYVTEKTKSVKYLYRQMFKKSDNTNGVFGFLARTLEIMITTENKDFQENNSINPFENSNGILKKLANIESKYSVNITSNSFRDGDKSVYGFSPSKFATTFLGKIKNNPEVVKNKKQIPFDQNSFLMYLLENDEDFSSKLSIDHLGINAFKEAGKKLYKDSTLQSLADNVHELVKLGMFMDNQQGEVKTKDIVIDGVTYTLPMRMARMFFPTMSDKSAMLDMTTAIIDFKTSDFEIDENGFAILDENKKNFLFTQLIEPELKRIVAHHKLASNLGMSPNNVINQKGYNMGAQIFNMIPEMNNLMYTKKDGTEIRLIEFIADMGAKIDEATYQNILENIRPASTNLLDKIFNEQANKKVEVWEESGFINKNADGKVLSTSFLDGTYMSSKQGDIGTKVKIASLDFTINSLLSNANIHMLIAGDVANYSQDKAFKNNILDNKPYMPVNNEVYSKMSSEIVGVNLGKRLALLIAPGNTISQSKNDKYIQLFLKDRVSVSENIEYLVEMYYGKEALKNNLVDIKAAKLGNQEAIDKMSNTFSDIKDYFKIESTDAQEYTTTKEHLDVLFRQGRLTTFQYNSANNKIENQKKAEREGNLIAEEDLLSNLELELIFQPIKPVYTGQLSDTNTGVSRIMYIKSSSFPLIPQLTLGFPGLDNLRRKMEEIETKSGKNVRASYDTANKVGAVLGANQLEIWNNDGTFNNESIDVDNIVEKINKGEDSSAMLLDREFFRIQQDVPFKSSKKNSQDTNTVGTQMMKIIFGNGISKITDKIFDYNNQKLSGVELHKKYNERFEGWVANEKTLLYDSLGINEKTGEAINKHKTVQKLQNILKQEAEKRGYPRQDIEALELDTNGDLKDAEFIIPLWLSPNSNRYEALLNAIVTSRLLNLKLPGAAYVAASEEGFKTIDSLDGIDQSRVIFREGWTGELRGTRFEDGSLKTAQVLIPSKLRANDGSLLDLFEKIDEDNYKYVTQKPNGSFFLKEDMFDGDLLSMSSFRIPTSSKVSLSQIEIVGILPIEVGDLIIVPKNFTKQKGLDFDVDKENTYMLHHKINSNGKVVKLEDDLGYNAYEIDAIIEDVNNSLEDLITRKEENRLLIEEYKDELEVYDTYPVLKDFDRTHVKSLIRDLSQEIKNEDIKSLVRYLKELRNIKTKLNQNEIIKIYSSILSNSDRRVQEKVNKVLSTEFAESQADLIGNLTSTAQDNSLFTVLSDEYQKYKLSLGAAGKLGIGVYSNAVVLHALIQQVDTTVNLMTSEFSEDGKKRIIPYALRIGNIQSEGTLGNIDTIKPDNISQEKWNKIQRSITDVNAELQNTATDNEKLQVMGKLNINELTINAQVVMSLLGIDKDLATVDGKEQSVSIPYLLMSQPIIKEYVKELRKTKSTIAEFDAEAKQKVVAKLMAKYSGEQLAISQEEKEENRLDLTGQNLVDSILDGGTDGKLQSTVLDLFLELDSYGEEITTLQGRLNIQGSGLGKSIFEMRDKYSNVAKLEYMSKISNVSSLIGDYISGEDYFTYTREELLEKGYTIFDRESGEMPFAVKPTTVTGSLVVNASKSGYELWNDYFPQSNVSVSNTLDEILGLLSSEDATSTRKIKLKTDIFQELKKYIMSSSQLGVFEGDPQKERERLFFDRGDNQSLSSYLKNLVSSDHHSREFISGNKIISKFQYGLETGALPSIIKFNNSTGEDFNEEYKYLAFVELMDKNIKLPDYNGKPYTSRMLAKDLISFAYLQGGVQQAIEFVKYVPVAYLKEIGFAGRTQLWQRAAKYDVNNAWGIMLGTSINPEVVSRFALQYIQHNGGKLPKITVEQIDSDSIVHFEGKKGLYNMESFTSADPYMTKPFISIYNKKAPLGFSKFQIYKLENGRYTRVANLGTFGMSEYSIRDNNIKPLMDAETKHVINVQPVVPPVSKTLATSDTFNLLGGNLSTSLDKIVEKNIPGISAITKELLPYINNNVKLIVGQVPYGNAIYQNNTITISSSAISKLSEVEIARLVLHEYIHSLTAPIINQYYNEKGEIIKELPANMRRLDRLYNEMVKHLGSELQEFKDWYALPGNQGKVRSEKDLPLYAGMNIHEFTTMILSDPSVQKKMLGVEYKSTGKSLYEQFIFALKEILSELGVDFKNTFTAEAMSAVLDTITENETLAKENQNPFTKFGISPTQSISEMELNKILEEEAKRDEQRQAEEDSKNGSDFLSPELEEESENIDDSCLF